MCGHDVYSYSQGQTATLCLWYHYMLLLLLLLLLLRAVAFHQSHVIHNCTCGGKLEGATLALLHAAASYVTVQLVQSLCCFITPANLTMVGPASHFR